MESEDPGTLTFTRSNILNFAFIGILLPHFKTQIYEIRQRVLGKVSFSFLFFNSSPDKSPSQSAAIRHLIRAGTVDTVRGAL